MVSALSGPQSEPRHFIPRKDRRSHWGQVAFNAARAAGAPALAATEAAIEASFGVAAINNQRKCSAERLIRFGFDHPEVGFRFARYARTVSLPKACEIVELDYRRLKDEAARRARMRGTPAPRVPDNVNDELRMILRFIRRFAPSAWEQVREPLPQAAE